MIPGLPKFSEIRKLTDREVIMLLVIVLVNVIWLLSYQNTATLRQDKIDLRQELKEERLGRAIDRVNHDRIKRENDSLHRREVANLQTTMSELVNPLVKQSLADMAKAKAELDEMKRNRHLR